MNTYFFNRTQPLKFCLATLLSLLPVSALGGCFSEISDLREGLFREGQFLKPSRGQDQLETTQAYQILAAQSEHIRSSSMANEAVTIIRGHIQMEQKPPHVLVFGPRDGRLVEFFNQNFPEQAYYSVYGLTKTEDQLARIALQDFRNVQYLDGNLFNHLPDQQFDLIVAPFNFHTYSDVEILKTLEWMILNSKNILIYDFARNFSRRLTSSFNGTSSYAHWLGQSSQELYGRFFKAKDWEKYFEILQIPPQAYSLKEFKSGKIEIRLSNIFLEGRYAFPGPMPRPMTSGFNNELNFVQGTENIARLNFRFKTLQGGEVPIELLRETIALKNELNRVFWGSSRFKQLGVSLTPDKKGLINMSNQQPESLKLYFDDPYFFDKLPIGLWPSSLSSELVLRHQKWAIQIIEIAKARNRGIQAGRHFDDRLTISPFLNPNLTEAQRNRPQLQTRPSSNKPENVDDPDGILDLPEMSLSDEMATTVDTILSDDTALDLAIMASENTMEDAQRILKYAKDEYPSLSDHELLEALTDRGVSSAVIVLIREIITH